MKLYFSARMLASSIINTMLIVISVVCLAPLLWMFTLSFFSNYDTGQWTFSSLLASLNSNNYRHLFVDLKMGRYLVNSLAMSVGVTFISLLFNVLAGYAFAKLHFYGREIIIRILLIVLVIPAQISLLPLFLLIKHLHLVNTYLGVILPSLASAFGIFLVRQYARSIPDALLEAARMDGADEIKLFIHIVFPLLSPVFVTLAIFTFMASWNDFMWPLLVLANQRNFTLPIALSNIAREHVMDTSLMMAGSVITVMPVLCIFLLLQRFYQHQLIVGSVKG